MHQVISVLLENKPGALMRVTGVVTAKGYNIESLTIAPTENHAFSRMTMVVDSDLSRRAQIVRQILKLISVLEAVDLTQDLALSQEIAVLRVESHPGDRLLLHQVAQDFQAVIANHSLQGTEMTIAGNSEKLDCLIAALSQRGKVQVARSGLVALGEYECELGYDH